MLEQPRGRDQIDRDQGGGDDDDQKSPEENDHHCLQHEKHNQGVGDLIKWRDFVCNVYRFLFIMYLSIFRCVFVNIYSAILNKD